MYPMTGHSAAPITSAHKKTPAPCGEAAKATLRELGGEIKDIYVTTGQYDVLLIADAPDGDVMTKFALAIGAQGNVRTTTCRGFTESEFQKIVSDLP